MALEEVRAVLAERIDALQLEEAALGIEARARKQIGVEHALRRPRVNAEVALGEQHQADEQRILAAFRVDLRFPDPLESELVGELSEQARQHAAIAEGCGIAVECIHDPVPAEFEHRSKRSSIGPASKAHTV